MSAVGTPEATGAVTWHPGGEQRISPSGVNRGLTSGRSRRRVVENDEYAAFTRRMVAAHGRRIAAGDVEGLAELAAVAEHVEHALQVAVAGLRAAGYSWAEITAPLGISRQAGQQRWGTERGDR